MYLSEVTIFQIFFTIVGVMSLLLVYRGIKDGFKIFHLIVLFLIPFFTFIFVPTSSIFIDNVYRYTYPTYEATVVDVEAYYNENEEEGSYCYSLITENNQRATLRGDFSSEITQPSVGDKIKVGYRNGKLIEYSYSIFWILVLLLFVMVITFVPLLLMFLFTLGVDSERIKRLGLLSIKVILPFILLLFVTMLFFDININSKTH